MQTKVLIAPKERIKNIVSSKPADRLGILDLDIEFYTDDAIDINEIIRNQIILAVPFNPLCKEDCKGLCPQCGMNRNHGTCECSGEEVINPKMAILKDFFKK